MRRLLATLAALLACVLLPLALVAAWLGAVVDDTDSYVDAVGPLATDQRVIGAVERSLTERTLRAVTDRLPLGEAAQDDFEPVVAGGVRTVLTSEQFPPAWEAANADAHRQLLAQLRGPREGADAGDGVVLDFGSVLQRVLDEVGGALPVQVDAPDVAVPVTVLQGEQVQQARAAYDVLDAARVVGPLAWLGLVVLALLLSPRRPRTLALLGVGSAVTLGLLLVALGLARDRVVAEVAAADRALSGAVWDGVTASLDLTVHAALVGCLAVVVLGALTGLVGRRSA